MKVRNILWGTLLPLLFLVACTRVTEDLTFEIKGDYEYCISSQHLFTIDLGGEVFTGFAWCSSSDQNLSLSGEASIAFSLTKGKLCMQADGDVLILFKVGRASWIEEKDHFCMAVFTPEKNGEERMGELHHQLLLH